MKFLHKLIFERKYRIRIFLAIILSLVVCICTKAFYNYGQIHDDFLKTYIPVRIDNTISGGFIYMDENDGNKIKSSSVINIENYDSQEQTVSFLVYYNNIRTDVEQLFTIEHVYIYIDAENTIEVENGVVKIPGGEKQSLRIVAVARDGDKVETSRSGPQIKVVNLD